MTVQNIKDLAGASTQADGFNLEKIFPQSTEQKKMTAVIACLSCLICLALLAIGVGLRAGDHWGAALERNYLLELRSVPEIPPGEQVETAMRVLRNLPNKIKPVLLSDSEIKELMAPWLGERLNLEDLPLSKLIRIEIFSDDIKGALKNINQEIAEIPGASMEGYHEAKAEYKAAGHSLRLISFAAACILIVIVSAVTAISTESNVLDNRNVIHTMRLIGSENSLITKIFTNVLLKKSLRGALAGLMFALLIICAVSIVGALEGLGATFIFAQFVPRPEILALLPIAPLTVMIVTFFTVRRTMRNVMKDFI